MDMGTEPTGRLLEVNGATIYHEVRGSGPSMLFIQGAFGDGGTYEQVAELLADEFTVVTYDRRANSRSPRPTSWESTSTEEQADDAASLIEALDIAPAAVFGNSGGAIIGLNLIIRHPHLLRGAILHDPAMFSVLSSPEDVMEPIQQAVEKGMREGGPRGGGASFLRFFAGDEAFEHLEPELRERMLGNAEVFFGLEFGTIGPYRPHKGSLAAVDVPVRVMAGTESPPPLVAVARWLADRLNVELERLPGGHTPYFDRPEEMAETIRPLFREMSGQPV
jgi:pimeloyl-ACP methyl ester carboxylesterase